VEVLGPVQFPLEAQPAPFPTAQKKKKKFDPQNNVVLGKGQRKNFRGPACESELACGTRATGLPLCRLPLVRPSLSLQFWWPAGHHCTCSKVYLVHEQSLPWISYLVFPQFVVLIRTSHQSKGAKKIKRKKETASVKEKDISTSQLYYHYNVNCMGFYQ